MDRGRRGGRGLMDSRVEKAISRFKEIGGTRIRKITEDEIRIIDAITALEAELEREQSQKKPSKALIDLINSRLIIKKRELIAIKNRG